LNTGNAVVVLVGVCLYTV